MNVGLARPEPKKRDVTTGLAAVRVMQLVHSNEHGGVEALSASIAEGLAQQGVTVETHFLYPKFAVGKWTKIRGIVTTIREIARRRPDVLIAYQSTASVLVGVIGWMCRVPVRIVHQTSVPDEVDPAVRALDRWTGAHRFYTANIANSRATVQAFDHYPGAYRSALSLIEHGVKPPEPRCSRAETLARFGIPADSSILLNAGRLSDQKAQDVVIRALPLLAGMRFVVAGGGPNEAAYRALAADLGVAERVHLLGYVSRDDVGDLLGAADVFVFPSLWETFGLAPAEAAMVGVPVIASDLAVLREVLSVDGANGRLPCAAFVAGNAPGDWAAAITAVAGSADSRHDAQTRAPLLRAKYGEDRMIAAYVDLVTRRP